MYGIQLLSGPLGINDPVTETERNLKMIRQFNTLMFATDGSSALAPEVAPRLVLIDGGKSKEACCANAVHKAGHSASKKFPLVQCILAAAVSCLLAVGLFALDATANVAETNALENVSRETINVKGGESLWSIASEHGIEGCSTQSVVDWIRSENQLVNSYIYAGQQLIVPASSNL